MWEGAWPKSKKEKKSYKIVIKDIKISPEMKKKKKKKLKKNKKRKKNNYWKKKKKKKKKIEYRKKRYEIKKDWLNFDFSY